MAEKIIGIDIGGGSIKAVMLARGLRGRHRILDARLIELQEAGGVPEALDQLFADQSFSGAVCITTLSPGRVSFRNVRLPFRNKKKISQTIAYALEPLIQQPLDEVFIDYTMIGRTEPSEVFAVLADRDYVRERTSLLSPHVRDTAVIDIDAVPLVSFLMQQPGFPACGLLLDIGAQDTTAIFAGMGRLLHIRHFRFGGDAITGAIARAMEIDSGAAEILKRGNNLPEEAAAAVREVRDRFLSELKNTQAFLLDRGGIPESPSRIILTGGGGLTPGIAEGISRVFSVSVERTDLIASGGFEIGAPLRSSWNPAIMDQALALAVRPMGKGTGFNFRQRESEARAGYGEFQGHLKKATLAAGILFVLAGVEIGLDDYGNRIRLNQIKQEIAAEFHKIDPETKRIVDPMVQIRGKIAEEKKLAAGINNAVVAVTVLDLLREVSSLAPPDLQVASLNLDGASVSLKGEARNFDAVENIKKTLASSKLIKSVTIGSTNLMKQGTGVTFDLKMVLNK
jgi:general secretion pathway protein L